MQRTCWTSEYLLAHCERYRVESDVGTLGYVDEVILSADGREALGLWERERNAIRAAVSGRRYISESVWQPPLAMEPGKPHDVLTPRQREVLQLVAEGKSGKEIANILDISVKTVEFHKATLMDRLGMRTTAELTKYALEHLIAGG